MSDTDRHFRTEGLELPAPKVIMYRPDTGNSWSYRMIKEMLDLWDWLSSDEAAHVRCIILTGAGDRHFSTGMDMKGWGPDDGSDPYRAPFNKDRTLWQRAILRGDFPAKPTIAAINGDAYGGGVEILLATDYRIAVESATFSLSEARRGAVTLGGSTARLAHFVGRAKAQEMLMLGREYSAEQMLAAGLLNEVVPDLGALEEATERVAGEFTSAVCPNAVAAFRMCLNQGLGYDLDEALELEELHGMHVMNRSLGVEEGATAFFTKQPPQFTGGWIPDGKPGRFDGPPQR